MAIVIKPGIEGVGDFPNPTIFLAGSIEMGAAEDWQKILKKHLKTKM